MRVTDTTKIKLTKRHLKRGNAEIASAVGKLQGTSRRVAIVAAYIPPQTKEDKSEEAMKIIHTEISKLKTDYEDPFIILAGDFNKKPTGTATDDFPDTKDAEVGATRRGASLDLVFTNFDPDIHLKEVRPPLTTRCGKASDHDIIFMEASLTNDRHFKWNTYACRPRTKLVEKGFSE